MDSIFGQAIPKNVTVDRKKRQVIKNAETAYNKARAMFLKRLVTEKRLAKQDVRRVSETITQTADQLRYRV
jgi:hypothetical protein